MIPTFPKFKKLSLSDIHDVRNLTKIYPPYSDFNFISMYCYDVNNDFLITELNGNLVVRFKEYESEGHFYSFLGSNEPLDTVIKLMELSKIEGLDQVLKLVPEQSIKPLLKYSKKSAFKIFEDPANFDYIISVSKLLSLRGTKIYSYKNLIRRFYKSYPDTIFRRLDLKNSKDAENIIKLFWQWAKSRKKSDEEIKYELEAIHRLLSLPEFVELVSLGAYLNNELIGFSIEEIVHDGFAMAHFGKADIAYKGIFQVLEYENAKILESNQCDFINLEQDLGIEGLKRNKKNWDPVIYLKKYLVKTSFE